MKTQKIQTHPWCKAGNWDSWGRWRPCMPSISSHTKTWQIFPLSRNKHTINLYYDYIYNMYYIYNCIIIYHYIYISTLYRHEHLSGSEASDFSAWVGFMSVTRPAQSWIGPTRTAAPGQRLCRQHQFQSRDRRRKPVPRSRWPPFSKTKNVFAGESFQSWKIMGVYPLVN